LFVSHFKRNAEAGMRTAFSSPDWDSYADPSVRTILCRGRLSGSISQGTLLKQETLLENHKPCAVVRRPSMNGAGVKGVGVFSQQARVSGGGA
jgi:hypothetical protein